MQLSTLQQERIDKLDMIRGFAVFGIFFVNMPSLTESDPDFFRRFVGIDQYIRLFYDLFIQTKFYSIFSFLFGIGFYLFMSRAEEKGLSYRVLFMKRLLILFIIGSIHYILFWDGDILHTYAAWGIVLFIFYHRKPITILIWAVLFLLFSFLLPLNLLGASFSGDTESMAFNYFHEWLAVREMKVDKLLHFMSNEWMYTDIISLFLFGLYAGKINLFRRITEFKLTIRKWQLISLLLSLIFLYPMINGFLKDEIYLSINYYFWIFVSGKTLAVVYVTTIMLVDRKWLKYIGYVGQMALTNYMLQTLTIVVVLPLFINNTASLSLSIQVVIVVVIYSLQIAFSKWWLAHYRFGPLEWLWRTGTYGKFQMLKRNVE